MEYHVFKYPYILIEDETGRYRPFYREYKEDSKETSIPKISFEQPGEKEGREKNEKKPGVCEMCVVRYSDYEHHILEKTHVDTVKRAANYDEVDELIRLLKKEKTVTNTRKTKKRLFEQGL